MARPLPIQENRMSIFHELNHEISQHESNITLSKMGYSPLFSASQTSRIIIIGQAPGRKAQETGVVWNDASGQRLIQWLGINDQIFRNPSIISHVPMDFYYPGKGPSGDMPPRKEFADLWHHRLLSQMPNVKLTLLIGRYAQNYYLKKRQKSSLTETVRSYREYLPSYFPIVHPSPLNFRWLNNNKWFESEIIPELQQRVQEILKEVLDS